MAILDGYKRSGRIFLLIAAILFFAASFQQKFKSYKQSHASSTALRSVQEYHHKGSLPLAGTLWQLHLLVNIPDLISNNNGWFAGNLNFNISVVNENGSCRLEYQHTKGSYVWMGATFNPFSHADMLPALNLPKTNIPCNLTKQHLQDIINSINKSWSYSPYQVEGFWSHISPERQRMIKSYLTNVPLNVDISCTVPHFSPSKIVYICTMLGQPDNRPAYIYIADKL